MAKKTRKKTTKKSAAKPATQSALPSTSAIPEGMKQMGGGYAPSWKPETIGETLHGLVTGQVREVEFKQGRKVVQREVMEITSIKDETRTAVWRSAALGEFFDAIAALGDDFAGQEVFLQYDGLGKAKPGQNAPKLFTVALAD